MDKMLKFYSGVVKEVDETERTLTVLISTPDVDRMGEVVDPMGVDLTNYQKNPVVLWAHKYDQPPIAKSLWIKKTKEGILAKPQFALTMAASEIYHLYKDGFLNCWSVGFLPQKWEDGQKEGEPKRRYTECELLEYSAVPVPANPQAITQIRTIVKSAGIVADIEDEQKKLEGEVLKPEENEETIRIPVAAPKEDDTIRTITISEKEGIKALYAVERKLILTYLFDKAKGWTMEKAREWVKEHSKSFEPLPEWLLELDETITGMTEAYKTLQNQTKETAETAETLATELKTAQEKIAELELKLKGNPSDDSVPIETPKKAAEITEGEVQAMIEKAIAGALTKEFNRQLGKT